MSSGSHGHGIASDVDPEEATDAADSGEERVSVTRQEVGANGQTLTALSGTGTVEASGWCRVTFSTAVGMTNLPIFNGGGATVPPGTYYARYRVQGNRITSGFARVPDRSNNLVSRNESGNKVAAEPLGEVGNGLAAFSKTLDQAAVALSNEMMGGAQKVLEMSVEYAKVRVQFGRPIGSFQAIKHKCADMLLEVESGKSAAYYASWAAAEDNDELPVVAALSKAYCSEAYFHATAENIQIHGGIGFTWEHPAHLYFKRAKSSEIFLGDATYHRELLAQRIGV